MDCSKQLPESTISSLKLAALWKLPVIYVCENNRYTEYTYFSEVMAGELTNRPQAFGIPVIEVDGQDIREVRARILEELRLTRESMNLLMIDAITVAEALASL